jgi:hypothetical protein
MEKLPKDLEEAKELLKKFEYTFNWTLFFEAFSALDIHIEKCKNCAHWEWIRNVRISHTRILLQNLSEFENWAELMHCLTMAKPYINIIEEESLRMKANDYIRAHEKEYKELFREQLKLGI